MEFKAILNYLEQKNGQKKLNKHKNENKIIDCVTYCC